MTIPAPAAPTSTAPKQKSPVGLAALIVGAVAFVFAIVPVLSFIAWLPAIAAIVLGIIGLVQKGRARGFAWAGIALGVVAWIVAIVVSISSVAGLAGAVSEAVESASAAPVAPSSIAAPAETAEAEPAEASAPAEPAQPAVPSDFISALAQAESYSNIMHMSKAGVFDQLTSEYGGQFTPEAAQYAIDNVSADWNANALESAKTFRDSMSMSPAAIYDQLVSEYGSKFTAEEAQYAVDNLG
ncbi:hypothetical protein FHS07_001882 [Microbacterium proteolyticum]|uniref:Putative host cell surface-exposed lipoprotein Ltp-like HTH region domain-containing protein n=1 Tax=Microbacterium proteolyticum TaxID=1572644 RepID=A0A7W5GFL9_9MICO|nr:Ltp family lipoprotein [Microbacterium proteolyticum]MBB3158186.1 hypothetical protein [Microbacterium proteolyticum]